MKDEDTQVLKIDLPALVADVRAGQKTGTYRFRLSCAEGTIAWTHDDEQNVINLEIHAEIDITSIEIE